MRHTVEKRLMDRIVQDPYPHGVVTEALDWDYYEELEAAFPDPNDVLPPDHASESNKLIQCPAAVALQNPKVPDIWKDFIRDHTSKEFLTKVIEVDEGQAVGIRHTGAYNINMECQFAYNTPTTEITRVRGPHVDNPIEVYAFLLYFSPLTPSTGGDLIMYRWKGEPKFIGKAEAEDDNVVEIARCPYGRNTLAFTMNTQEALHGVDLRIGGYRRYINIIAEVENPRFTLPR